MYFVLYLIHLKIQFWCYIKQLMNVFICTRVTIIFMEWKIPSFTSLKYAIRHKHLLFVILIG
jgi:hypothetical protein